MVQEFASRAEREEAAGEALAERLDALTLPLAQSVLGRAVEIDAEERAIAESAAETMDYETLRDVALEAGISEKALKRALLEELDTEQDHNARPIERIAMPRTIRGGLIVDADADHVIDRIERHLGHRSPWRHHLSGSGTAVRHYEGLDEPVEVWTVAQRRPGRQLVEIDIDTRTSRQKAWRWLIGLAIVAMLFGTWLGPLLFFGVMVAGMIGVVSWARRMAKGLRRRVNRALRSLIDDDDDDDDIEWLDLIEELFDD